MNNPFYRLKSQPTRFLIALFYSLLFLSFSLPAQIFENTSGSLVNNEEARDGKPIPGGRYIMLSNTVSFGAASKILLTRLSAAGNVELFVTIQDPLSATTSYFGTSIDLDLDLNAPGAHIGYFITGHRNVANGRQMILLRTDLNGLVTWTRILPNGEGGVVLNEYGVSVERQSNADVLVTGASRHPSTNVFRFIVARFSSAGGFMWSQRYATTTTSQGYEAIEACNGFRSGVAVLAVTGRYRVTPTTTDNHTFLSCINATTGVENWRRVYNSAIGPDAGLDVVYKRANGSTEPEAFMAVGGAGTPHPALWVVRANPTTGLASTKVYTPGGFSSGFVAEAVNLDVTGTKAAISGSVLTQFPPAVLLSGTFAMVLPFYGTELPDWIFHYASSSPNGLGVRSISPVAGAIPGYFVTCATRLGGSAFSDQHAIRVNSLGVGVTGCARTALTPIRTPTGTSFAPTFIRSSSAWTAITLGRTPRNFREEGCTAPKQSFDAEMNAAPTNLADVGGLQLIPNPTATNQAVRLAFQLPDADDFQIRIFDLTGREVFSTRETGVKGQQDVEISTASWPLGTYMVQLSTSSGIQETKKLVVVRE